MRDFLDFFIAKIKNSDELKIIKNKKDVTPELEKVMLANITEYVKAFVSTVKNYISPANTDISELD
jgi:hypothetical protein